MKTWSSKTYKRAANKHYQTCEQLLSLYDNLRKDSKPHIVSNIFYLSGYVLECILKYYLLELEHCSKELTIEELRSKGLKTHDINELWQKVDSGINKKDYQWTDICKRWNVDVRYANSDIVFKEAKDHFEKTIRPIYLKVRAQY